MLYIYVVGRRWNELDLDEEEEGGVSRSDSTSSSGREEGEVFRARASTDSRLPPRHTRARHPAPPRLTPAAPVRRMSVSMRGNNASTY